MDLRLFVFGKKILIESTIFNMGLTLIIVESPSKAEHIQEFLGKDYVVMASYGHIADLAKGGRHGMGIDIENNFKPHYVLMPDKIAVLDRIMKVAKMADLILLCSDNDREGESISWHLKERLDGISAPMKRAVFNEITKKAVLKGIAEAGDINMNIVKSQETRRALDRIVGFSASPFLMNCVSPKLSAGRVQSVVTRLVIDREREIESFVPEEFWTIQVALSTDNKSVFFTKFPGKLPSAKAAEDMRSKLEDNTNESVVSNVVSSEEKKSPPPPLVTSTLQQVMSRIYGFGAERTMKAAQSLYESGYCTY